jgi:transcriptional regulator with XRE-family HTH domain
VPTDDALRGLTSLAQLVMTRKDALNLSYRAIATHAGISTANVHKIASGKLTRVPSPRTIAGLASALQVPEQTLIAAAVADLGLREFVLEEGERRAIYLATGDLDADQRAIVLSVINSMRKAEPITVENGSKP